MSLVATLTRSLRAQYQGNVDKNEVRPSQYGGWQHFREDSMLPDGILNDDLKTKIERSFGNSVQIPVLDADDVTISNVRSCTIADDDNTSALMTLSFATFAFGFTMYPVDYYVNDIQYQADYNRKLKKYLLKLAATFDAQSIAQLESDKNQYNAGLSDYYAVVGNSLQVSQAEKEDFYNNLSAIKRTQDFYDGTKIIHNPPHTPLVQRLDNQGANNGTNEQFQLRPYNWRESNSIANGAGVQSTGYAATVGNCGVHYRLDPDALAGRKLSEKEWSVVDMPFVDMPMGTYYNADCSDRSGNVSGAQRTVRESFEFSADLCWFTAYNSNPAGRYNPIQKFEIMSA